MKKFITSLCLCPLFLCFVINSKLFAQLPLPQHIAAYYLFSGNAKDSSGKNNNPTFNNATLTCDRFGKANKAYSFNGSQYIMALLHESI